MPRQNNRENLGRSKRRIGGGTMNIRVPMEPDKGGEEKKENASQQQMIGKVPEGMKAQDMSEKNKELAHRHTCLLRKK